MGIMYTELIPRIEKFAEKYCKQDPEDPKLWDHVQLVRKYAKQLAEIEGADKQVVEIAALLHDIGKHKGRKNHHIRGYNLAKDLLKDMDLPEQKKKLILKCILKHRTRFCSEDNETEVKIVQSADTLGALFHDEWQEYCRKTMPKDKLLKFYERANEIINLESARKIAEPQIEKLKKQLNQIGA